MAYNTPTIIPLPQFILSVLIVLYCLIALSSSLPSTLHLDNGQVDHHKHNHSHHHSHHPHHSHSTSNGEPFIGYNGDSLDIESKNILRINIDRVDRLKHRKNLLLVTWNLSNSYFNCSDNSHRSSVNSKCFLTKHTPKLFLHGFIVSHTLFEDDNLTKSHGHLHFSDIGIEFKSETLPQESRSFVLHDVTTTHFDECVSAVLKVCVYAIFRSEAESENRTEGLTAHKTKTCLEGTNRPKPPSSDDNADSLPVKKVAAGVGAALIFLIPCGVVLVYIVRKDAIKRSCGKVQLKGDISGDKACVNAYKDDVDKVCVPLYNDGDSDNVNGNVNKKDNGDCV